MFVWNKFKGCFGDRTTNTTKAVVRAPHTTSVRGNLVRTYRVDINEDYFVDADQELGKGGCGVVVVGEHKETRAQYAIKIVDKAHAERGRLDRELKLLKDVDHTNVVRLFSVYDVPSHMYFVMELCTGGHLGNLLARQPKKYLDEVWAKQLALQLLSAVAHIHSRGIAHRDIKLQNILVDQNNDREAQLKLIDFGYGSRYVGALPMRTKCGTPYTTAPEVIREHYDERCDVWSCGVVLYIMLCGRRPFEALNITGTLADAGKAAMITNILACRYHFNHKPWQSVSKQGLYFVKALLHPDFKQRMHSHEALENPWLVDTALTTVQQQVLVSEKSFRAVENMRRMSDVTELQRTGMVALVFGINGKVTAEMSAVFQSFDTDSSGMLSIEEFSSAMHKLAPELLPQDMEKLFHIIDYDKNNLISYTEFLAATIDPRDVDIGELNKAFRVFDEDGNGYISKEEMRKIIRSQCEQALANEATGEANKGGLSPRSIINGVSYAETLAAEVDAKVDKIFTEADVNNDGAISHAEFLWVMTGLDFHLLDRMGLPAQGVGFSAKDTFLYNTKLNNSHDSYEWERDPHFDEEMGQFSPRSIQSQTSNSVIPIKQSFKGGRPPPEGAPPLHRANTGFETMAASSSFTSNLPNGSSSRQLAANSGSFHRPISGYRPINTPVNSPHTRAEWPDGPLVAGISARLDTYMERVGLNNSSSSGALSEEAHAIVVERPMQRSEKRRPDPNAERKDTPPLFKGNLSPRNVADSNAEFLACSKDDVSGTLRGISPKANQSAKNSIAYYEVQPNIDALRNASEDEQEQEMGVVVIPTPGASAPTSAPTSSKNVPPLSMPRALANNFMGGAMGGSGASTKSGRVTFDRNLYQRDDEADDKDDRDDLQSNRSSAKELRGTFSRQPSYRESTIIDSSNGKDTIKVMSMKESVFEDQEANPSATSTRQNSGGTVVDVHVMGVEKSEGPIPPFLSRAGSRVFSLSNMLRSNDLSHSHHDNSKAMSPLPVGLADSSPTPVGSPGGYMPLSRAASIKSARLFGGEGGGF